LVVCKRLFCGFRNSIWSTARYRKKLLHEWGGQVRVKF
jgi:hypothetical protein